MIYIELKNQELEGRLYSRYYTGVLLRNCYNFKGLGHSNKSFKLNNEGVIL